MNNELYTDISRLPQEVLDQLKGTKRTGIIPRKKRGLGRAFGPVTNHILMILNNHSLNLDQIIIALYVDYKTPINRKLAHQTVYNLVTNGLLNKSVPQRIYSLTDAGRTILQERFPSVQYSRVPTDKNTRESERPSPRDLDRKEIVVDLPEPKRCWLPRFLRTQNDH